MAVIPKASELVSEKIFCCFGYVWLMPYSIKVPEGCDT